jgi:hypothetical protein
LLDFTVSCEANHRSAVIFDESVAFEALFERALALGRYHIASDYANSIAAAYFELHFPFRREIERQEARASLEVAVDAELNTRWLIVLEERHAVRELLFKAAVAVMRRIAQSQAFVRAVPSVSLYFFGEEEDIRRVIEEESETALAEMRLKERVFRMGMLRDARMRSKTLPKPLHANQVPQKERSPRPQQLSTPSQPPPPAAVVREPPAASTPQPRSLPLLQQRPVGSHPLPAKQRNTTPVAQGKAQGSAKVDSKVPVSTSKTGKKLKTTSTTNLEAPVVRALAKDELYALWRATKRRAPPGRLPPLPLDPSEQPAQ